jgi:hypothetical protein
MPKVASARVHDLYGDPVKGMALKQLESAALTQLQEACRPDPSNLERRSRSGALSAGAQERISSLKRLRDLTISSVLLESLGQTTFGAYARVVGANADALQGQKLTRFTKVSQPA